MTLDRLFDFSLQIVRLLHSYSSQTSGFWKAVQLVQSALHIAVFILEVAIVLLLYAIHHVCLILLWVIGATMVFILLAPIYRLVQLVRNRYQSFNKHQRPRT